MTGGMMFKGTPGPWFAEHQPFGSAIAANGVGIATVYETAAITKRNLPQKANARLIAAAPELLDELIRMANDMDSLGYDVTHARAAIAKALGEQK